MASDANLRYEVPGSLTARELVVDFLSNRAPHEMAVRIIVDSAAALGFSEQSIRMALTRLAEEGTAVNVGRGRYRLAPSGDAMRVEVRKWRTLPQQLRPWDGAWLAIYDSEVRRSERAAMRRHERAMRLRGFRELIAGLSVRPANIRDSVPELRAQLHALGLHRDAMVAELRELDRDANERAVRLWDVDSLRESYAHLMRAISTSTRRVERIGLDAAAAETMVLGRDVIRHINLDPLLPEELMPDRPLNELVEAMLAYDHMARQIWRRFMRQFENRD
jgi:phenylacetic acid degradation operon negative regulatory protein